MILEEVVSRLVTMFDAAVSVRVFDGPVATAASNETFVAVGSSGEDEDGIVVDLVLSDLGPGGWVDESGEIVCSAWSWSGGTDVASRRAAAVALAVTCANTVRADPQLSGLLVKPGRADVSAVQVRSQQTDKGALCRASFTVAYSHLST
jgi:hypothetical protein